MVATAIAIPPVILARKRLWQASYVPPDTHRRFAFPHPRLKDKLAFSAPGGEVLADRADDGRMMIPAIISTIQRDRVGDEVVPEGCRLDAYRRNPVVFFAHQDLPIPVGLAETPNGELAVRIVAGKHVEADCYFHQSSKEGPQFYVLVRDGIIRSTSIGFNPTEEPEKLGEIEGNLYAGYRFTGWELLEFSWVGVPANPYCGRVRQLLSAGKIAGEPISPMLRKSLEPLSEAAPIWEPSGFVQTVKSGDGREAEAQRAAFEQQFEHHAAHHPPARSILPGRHADRVLNGRLSLHLQRSAPETIRWNRSLSKAFDVEVMPSRACTAEYDWVSKHIGCKVKHLYQNGTGVPSARMGSFLTGLKHVLSEHKLNDVRNLTYDGTERPPRYEVVQLNSEKRDDFLVDGLAFYTAAHCKFALAVSPTWGGLILTVYTDQKDKGFNQQVLDRAWAWAKTNNFLKGEAFALSGEFLNRTSESWDDVFLEEENKQSLRRTIDLLAKKGASFPNRGVILTGPPGCLHADTPIYDPVDGSTLSVETRERLGLPFHVLSLNADATPVIAQAEAPWRYDPAEMVRLLFASGRSITVTKGHRFFAPSHPQTDQDGYVSAGRLVADLTRGGAHVALPSASVACELHRGFVGGPPVSSSEHAPADRVLNARHSEETTEDSMVCCSLGSRPCDGQLLPASRIARASSPRSIDARRRSHASSHEDDRGERGTRTGRALFGRLSSSGCTGLAAPPLDGESECQARADSCEPFAGLRDNAARLRGWEDPTHRGRQFEQPETENIARSFGDSETDSEIEYSQEDRLIQAEPAGVHPYFDFHVPEHENYWACGFFHHNTGKTLSGRIIRNQAKATFIWLSARDFYHAGSFGGLSFGFELAKELAPSVLFIEDVDNWLDSGTVDLVKTEMDGISRSTGVLTMLTTNFPERLPEALIDRPGRFHDVLHFALPTLKARQEMLAKWLPNVPAEQVQAVASKTETYSGAHLYELAHFARDLEEHDGLDASAAIDEAIRKVEEQRELITQIQLEGSHYRPRKSLAKATAGKTPAKPKAKEVTPMATTTKNKKPRGRIFAHEALKRMKAAAKRRKEGMAEGSGQGGGYTTEPGSSSGAADVDMIHNDIREVAETHKNDGDGESRDPHDFYFHADKGICHHHHAETIDEDHLKAVRDDLYAIDGIKGVDQEPTAPTEDGFKKVFPPEATDTDSGKTMTTAQLKGLLRLIPKSTRPGITALPHKARAAAGVALIPKKIKDALQDCVSAEIPKLIDAGYAQAEAQAIAYSKCGEGKDMDTDDGNYPMGASGDEGAAADQDYGLEEGGDLPHCAAFCQELIEMLESELPVMEPERRDFFEVILQDVTEYAEETYPDVEFGGEKEKTEPDVEPETPSGTNDEETEESLDRYRRSPVQRKGGSRPAKLKAAHHKHLGCIREASDDLAEMGQMDTGSEFTRAHKAMCKMHARNLDVAHKAMSEGEAETPADGGGDSEPSAEEEKRLAEVVSTLAATTKSLKETREQSAVAFERLTGRRPGA